MSKTILVTGKPGCGKSTLVKNVKDELQINDRHEYVSNENKKYVYYKNNHYYVLGKYDDKHKFGGLDSFAPKAIAVEMIEKIISEDPDARIICEGWVFKRYPYDRMFFLDTDNDTLMQRLELRRSRKPKNPNKPLSELFEQWDGFKRGLVKNWNAILIPHTTQEEMEKNQRDIIDYMTT